MWDSWLHLSKHIEKLISMKKRLCILDAAKEMLETGECSYYI